MRLEIQYRLFNLVDERYRPENYDRYTVVQLNDLEDKTKLYYLIKMELSRSVGRSPNDFDVLSYKEV
jgi:hypothetical protein